MKIDINIEKNLNNDEKEIFSIIRNVIESKTPSTKAYAVGGWVRDKLIGLQPDDLDIMVSNISGEKFARLVTEYLQVKDPHVIRANPDASKHIETAKAYIPLSSGNIQEVDFAQARQEVYEEGSRIPKTIAATPEDDAYRRDLTINSIFYDISNKQVVDFTGTGIKDLISNTIRTPTDPFQTFSEDPLRIFRTIRFAAKYNGDIDSETYEVLKNESLREKTRAKVSKERIGQEIAKMLKNPNPDKAIQLMKDVGLLDDIILESIRQTKYEDNMAPLDMEQNNPWHSLSVWGHTMEVVRQIAEQYEEAQPEKRMMMIMASLIHDLGKTYKEIWSESKTHPGRTSYIGHEFVSSKLANLILRYLKFDNKFIENVSKMVQNHMRTHSLDKAGVKGLRKFIRQMGEQAIDWLDVFNLAISDALAKDVIRDESIAKRYMELKNRLQSAIETTDSVSSVNNKPILSGNEVMETLDVKPGIWMQNIMEFVKEMKDENPNITKEEAKKLLKEEYNDNKYSFMREK